MLKKTTAFCAAQSTPDDTPPALIETEEKRTVGLTIVRGTHIISLSIESPPPADPSARLGTSVPSAAAGAAPPTLTAGPGISRPAGRGLPVGLSGPAAGVGGPPPPGAFGGFPGGPPGGFPGAPPPGGFAGRAAPPRKLLLRRMALYLYVLTQPRVQLALRLQDSRDHLGVYLVSNHPFLFLICFGWLANSVISTAGFQPPGFQGPPGPGRGFPPGFSR
jgi:hypothetical protein